MSKRPRALQRKDLKAYLKNDLKINAPRTGKKFKENIEKMDDLYRNMENSYQKDYLGQYIREYYFKYNTRHKNRTPLDIKALRGGALKDCCNFCELEGGFLFNEEDAEVKGIKNLVNSNPTKSILNDGESGELHAILQTPEGLKKANYMGPGTQLIKRLKRGDKPLTPADKVSLGHDIQYTLAQTPEDIREADTIMKRDLGRLLKKGKETTLNVAQGQLIKVKNLAENILEPLLKKVGVPNINELQLSENKLSLRDRKLLDDTLEKIQKEGYALKSIKKRKPLLLTAPPKKENIMMELKKVKQPKKQPKEEPKKEQTQPIYDQTQPTYEPNIRKQLFSEAKKAGKTLSNEELEELIKKIMKIEGFKGRKPLKIGKRF